MLFLIGQASFFGLFLFFPAFFQFRQTFFLGGLFGFFAFLRFGKAFFFGGFACFGTFFQFRFFARLGKLFLFQAGFAIGGAFFFGAAFALFFAAFFSQFLFSNGFFFGGNALGFGAAFRFFALFFLCQTLGFGGFLGFFAFGFFRCLFVGVVDGNDGFAASVVAGGFGFFDDGAHRAVGIGLFDGFLPFFQFVYGFGFCRLGFGNRVGRHFEGVVGGIVLFGGRVFGEDGLRRQRFRLGEGGRRGFGGGLFAAAADCRTEYDACDDNHGRRAD